ncbi:alpha,alpha-phosphotrehalase [Paenibacillus hunanensis]|uniref:Alpha,alpha-phosphotrehalase n=1 Tax=Paenibacillus hunanensis TaxID=539262 RepID=A0ABU1IZS4_9BACL|nr:alpha,alpha-phosphotrehalase [Paenibacillus hunanensis]MDR6244740.1 trehalose-6-phosphate hydrolase [Paenibacillus hunanensis]GGJ21920.1 trehalose-6-phosphate hydrolase [Paenibacillus hunanensis]
MNRTEWWRRSTVYQVYPRSFKDTTGNGIGDIRGLTEKLDYLQELGIDIIWLQPIYVSPQNDNGYDVADYRSIDPMYGTMDDFDELLQGIRQRNMRLMLDIVVNHSSTEHVWFKQSRQSRNNPYRDYYIWHDPAPGGGVPNNWQSKFGGSAWQYDEQTGQYYLALFDPTQADLNWENEQVRQEAAELMRFWTDKGVDGFRLDVINLISKDQRFPDDEGDDLIISDGRRFYTDGPRVHEYIKELYEKVFGPYQLVTVGEMSSTTLEHCIRYSNPEEREFSMTFNFHHLKVDYPQGKKWELMPYDFEALKTLLSQWQSGMYIGGGWNALFWNNHDQPRALSRFADDGRYRVESAKMLATTLHGLQGTPYIFQGEEIGMPNPNWNDISEFRDVESKNMYRIMIEMGKTPEEAFTIIARRSRDNARTPMQWDYSANAGFTTGTPWIKLDERYPEINVSLQQQDPNSILSHYKRLIALRKKEDVLIDGSYIRLDKQHPQIYAYARQNDRDTLVVMSNFTDQPAQFDLPAQLRDIDSASVELLVQNTEFVPAWENTVSLESYASYMWVIRG